MYAVSRVRNTQSRAQDKMSQQKKNAVGLSETRASELTETRGTSHQNSAQQITRRHQKSSVTKHENLRTPRSEYRVLFAEFSSQGGRSVPTSLWSPFPSPHATFLSCSPCEAWSVTCGSEMLFVSRKVHTERTSVDSALPSQRVSRVSGP